METKALRGSGLRQGEVRIFPLRRPAQSLWPEHGALARNGQPRWSGRLLFGNLSSWWGGRLLQRNHGRRRLGRLLFRILLCGWLGGGLGVEAYDGTTSGEPLNIYYPAADTYDWDQQYNWNFEVFRSSINQLIPAAATAASTTTAAVINASLGQLVTDSPFSAACDGSTDDSTAIQACVYASSGTRLPCRLPAGRTCVYGTGYLTLSSGTALSGGVALGISTATLKFTSNGGGGVCSAGSGGLIRFPSTPGGAKDRVLSNLSIRAASANSGCIINASVASGQITGLNLDQVNLYDDSNSTGTWGLVLGNVTNVYITHSYFATSLARDIYDIGTFSNGIYFRDNFFDYLVAPSTHNYQVELGRSAGEINGCDISNNVFEAGPRSVKLTDASGCTVANNYFSDVVSNPSTSSWITVSGYGNQIGPNYFNSEGSNTKMTCVTASGFGNHITGNMCDSADVAFDLEDSSGSVVMGNNCYFPGRICVKLSSSTANTIGLNAETGNYTTGSRYPYYCDGGSSANKITTAKTNTSEFNYTDTCKALNLVENTADGALWGYHSLALADSLTIGPSTATTAIFRANGSASLGADSLPGSRLSLTPLTASGEIEPIFYWHTNALARNGTLYEKKRVGTLAGMDLFVNSNNNSPFLYGSYGDVGIMNIRGDGYLGRVLLGVNGSTMLKVNHSEVRIGTRTFAVFNEWGGLELPAQSTATIPSLTVTTMTATGTGNSTYSITTSSGISVTAGMVVAPGGFNGPLYGSGAGIAAGTIDTAKLATDAVTSAAIINGGVATADLADSSVDTSKVATDAISTAKLLNSAVTTAKVQDSAIDTSKLATDSVSTVKLLGLSVTTAKLAEGSVNTSKLGTDSVTTDKIAGAAVTENKLAAGAALANLAAGSIDTSRLGTDSVSGAKILAGAVNTSKIATDAVQTQHIMGGAVTVSKIASNAVDTTKVNTDAIGTTQLQGGSVTANKLASGAALVNLAASSIDTTRLATDSVATSQILGLSVTTVKLAEGAVNTSKLGTDGVTTAKIINEAVDTTKLATDSVTAAKILDGTITPQKISTAGMLTGRGTAQSLAGAKIGWDGTNALIYGSNAAGTYVQTYFDASPLRINTQSNGNVVSGTGQWQIGGSLTVNNSSVTVANDSGGYAVRATNGAAMKMVDFSNANVARLGDITGGVGTNLQIFSGGELAGTITREGTAVGDWNLTRKLYVPGSLTVSTVTINATADTEDSLGVKRSGVFVSGAGVQSAEGELFVRDSGNTKTTRLLGHSSQTSYIGGSGGKLAIGTTAVTSTATAQVHGGLSLSGVTGNTSYSLETSTGIKMNAGCMVWPDGSKSCTASTGGASSVITFATAAVANDQTTTATIFGTYYSTVSITIQNTNSLIKFCFEGWMESTAANDLGQMSFAVDGAPLTGLGLSDSVGLIPIFNDSGTRRKNASFCYPIAPGTVSAAAHNFGLTMRCRSGATCTLCTSSTYDGKCSAWVEELKQ